MRSAKAEHRRIRYEKEEQRQQEQLKIKIKELTEKYKRSNFVDDLLNEFHKVESMGIVCSVLVAKNAIKFSYYATDNTIKQISVRYDRIGYQIVPDEFGYYEALCNAFAARLGSRYVFNRIGIFSLNQEKLSPTL